MHAIFGGAQELKSPLHYSVLGDPPRIEPSIEVLEFLLTHHKDINVKDEVRAMVW